MSPILHITSGDCAGALLAKTGIPGEILVWHDILYDGPRCPGWPDEETLAVRSRFLEQATAGGLSKAFILATLRQQYRTLSAWAGYARIVLWFDACLFDQAMLAHILACLPPQSLDTLELLCVDAFPCIVPFHGLGQLTPEQLASLYERRQPVSEAQWRFAREVDRAFAGQDEALLTALSCRVEAPLPWVPAAVSRWLAERPDPESGLGWLAALALAAIVSGCQTPAEIFTAVAKADTPPQYWGDITLWSTINSLADRHPPLVRIDGPAPRLPQWPERADLIRFRVTCLPPAVQASPTP